MIRFGKLIAQIILLTVVCQVIFLAFLISSSEISDELTISCNHYNSFYSLDLLNEKEEKESEESFSFLDVASLLDIHDHNFNLNRSHSHRLFPSVPSISYHFSLFCALLI
jgi:hypothetical protein